MVLCHDWQKRRSLQRLVSYHSHLIKRVLPKFQRGQVKYAIDGVTSAAWKRVDTKEIAYSVMTNALISRSVVVVVDV